MRGGGGSTHVQHVGPLGLPNHRREWPIAWNGPAAHARHRGTRITATRCDAEAPLARQEATHAAPHTPPTRAPRPACREARRGRATGEVQLAVCGVTRVYRTNNESVLLTVRIKLWNK